jgi:hypothetical protein
MTKEHDFDLYIKENDSPIITLDDKEDIETEESSIENSEEEEVDASEEPSEDEQEEEEEVDEKELLREKLYAEKKRRKGLYAERQNLAKENEALKKLVSNNIDTTVGLYAKDLYNELDKVKQLKRDVLVGNVPESMTESERAAMIIDADEVQQMILLKLNDLKNKQIDNQSEEDTEVEGEEINEERLETAKEWLEDNPELIEGSDEYDPKLHKDVYKFTNKLDRELRKAGKENIILSDTYFRLLDKYVDSIKRKVDTDGYAKSNVGSTRNNFASKGNGTFKVVLTEADKWVMSSMGIPEKEYIKTIIEEMKENRGRR